jgi:pheromone shutdown-related protein TraB
MKRSINGTAIPDFIVGPLVSPETGSQVYLVGTAHVSDKSAQEAAQAIQLLKPNAIVLELCRSRAGLLFTKEYSEPDNSETNNSSWLSISETRAAMKQANGASGLLYALLGAMYKSVTQQLKITPGLEFRRAYQEGLKIGSKIILGDRPVEITLKRTWAALSFTEKIRFMFHIIKESSFTITAEDIEKMKEADFLTEMVKEFSKAFPSLAVTMIDERDIYLAASLRKCPGPIVVGVVGLGHVRGIKENWNKPLGNTRDLLTIPHSRSWFGFFVKAAVFSTALCSVGFVLSKVYRTNLIKG